MLTLLPQRSALKALGLYELSRFDQRSRFWAKSLFYIFFQIPALSGTLAHPELLRCAVWDAQENLNTAFLGFCGLTITNFEHSGILESSTPQHALPLEGSTTSFSKLAFSKHFFAFLWTEGAFNRLFIDSERHPHLS